MPTGQTTAPARSASTGGRDHDSLAVAWVFPVRIALPTRIDGPALTFGRDESCALVLSGAEASRKHAELRRDGPLLVVRDLGSRNGTFVNGERVTEAPLKRGDVLRLGEWIGIVVALPDPRTTFSYQRLAPGLLGGPALVTAIEPARKAVGSDLPIVLVGETGTGKEMVARALHAWSGRSGDFVAVNCAALPESLAEAELFGYRKGAFTGADTARLGHVRSAQGGTLLLDELTDLPAAVQAKLLRVLEQREVLPLGESRPVPIDVRVIAATQEPLGRAVADKRLRADLMARLDGITVELPPLRERIEDVPYLFDELLREHAKGKPPTVEPRLIEALCLYDWPFNVRELVLLVRRLHAVHGAEALLRRADLPKRVLDGLLLATARGSSKADPDSVNKPTPETDDQRNERDLDLLLPALREQRGNVARAAAAIGVSRQRAYRLMQARPDLDLDDFRGGKGSP